MPNIPGIENINFVGTLATIIYWLGYGLLAALIIFIFSIGFYWFSYPIKASVFPMYGSGKDGVFSIGKRKYNRIRWNKTRTSWIRMFPVFKTVEVEPFDSEYIYPGKQVYAFELNDLWVPGRLNITQGEDEIRTEINPVPYSLRAWLTLDQKINEIDFAENNWWEQNKGFVYMLIAVALCCALCGGTVYLTYKFAAGGTGAMNNLADAIRNVATIQGK